MLRRRIAIAAVICNRRLAWRSTTGERRRVPRLARRFQGFGRDAMTFWYELASEMSREWFAENRQRYEEVWVTPLVAALEDVARRLGPMYRPLRLGEPGVLRIHRDLRFARDRTPYKTHIAGVLRLAGRPIAQAGNAVLYVELGLDGEYAGAGCYRFDGDKLARWRKAVAGKPGEALATILARLRRAGYAVGGDSYQRVPAGFARDHPRAELLKRRGLTCAFPVMPAGLLHQPAWVDWLVRHTRATAPLVIWLHRHVG
jgi:uncharacterized protein (TIGR02453 family)